MPSDQLYIGIDSGTQGTKAILFSREQGEILAEATTEHALIETNEGRREQDPAWWINACQTVVDEVLNADGVSREEVRAIGVSGQQHGMVPLDADGKVIRPAKLWCDTETTPQCQEITDRVGGSERVMELIGNTIAAGFTVSKILWLKEHEPENYDRLACVLLPHDYINFWLTGEQKSEYGDASGTAYLDVRNRTWSEPILDSVDPSGKLRSCLPQLIDSHEPVGTITPAIAERFGLHVDVMVSSGGGDNMMAAIGTGNVAPGIVTASLGTSGTIYSFSDRPVVDPKGELAAFCASSGGWLPLVCTMNVTVSTELIRGLLDLDIPTLNLKASVAPPGAGGIILLPYFNGERTPALPNAKASFHGLTSTNTTSENFCRAAMEGATLGLRYGLDVMRRQGIEPKEIRLVGGGAKSPLWRQMVADLFECPVVCPQTTEAGALGAALQAMWCDINANEGNVPIEEITDRYVSLDESTRTEPDASRVARYADIYAQYLQLNQVMKLTCEI